MTPLSVVIITFNEERNIQRCIDSVRGLADEILVVDSYSSDKTKSICLENNVRFIEKEFLGFGNQKNFANEQATYSLVLSLDADEALSPQLADSIAGIKQNKTADAYTMNRKTNYCGKWINHCWYPDSKLRLWEIQKGRWDSNELHEKLVLQPDTKVAKLHGDLLHYSYYTLDDYIAQLRKFNELGAVKAFKAGKKFTYAKLFLKPPAAFFKLYIAKKGFLDGYAGFEIAVISAFAKFLRYARLKQLWHEKYAKKS